MKILAIDSSGLVASVAVLEDDVLLASYTVDYKKTHSQTLLPMLDEICRMISLEPSDIDAVAVAAGPGSFTGLRIGSATAKGIALALDCPVIEVPTLAGMAFSLYNAKGLICPIMDARRNQVYNGLYEWKNLKLAALCDQRALGVDELAEELNRIANPEGTILLGDGVAVYREALDRLLTVPYSYAPAHVSRQRAASVGAYGLVLFGEGRYTSAAGHKPVYLRKSQAEREREEKERRDL